MEFRKKINPDNLIYKYKTEGRSPKDFKNYQNLMDLFKSLRDGNVNPREVLKNQNNFKLDRGKTRKGIPKSKSKDQISVIQNVETFFDLTEKIIDFFRDYYFLLSEAKYKSKYGKGLEILTFKQILQRLPLALAQVKAGNIKLNEFFQIMYSLY